jgi:hypothetical protein
VVTKDRAIEFIAYKDETQGLSWSADPNDLAMALVEFTEFAKDPKYHKSIPVDEEGIIDAINRIINKFYQESGNYYRALSTFSELEKDLMDNEVAELRAELATLLHMMASVTFKDLAAQRSSIQSRKDAAEAMAYDTCFQEALAKEWVTEEGDKFKKQRMSISVADSYARKVYKMDPKYVSEIKACDEIDNNYWLVNKIFDQAREVMNAMAKRIGKF